jgi:hypothetical protein
MNYAQLLNNQVIAWVPRSCAPTVSAALLQKNYPLVTKGFFQAKDSIGPTAMQLFPTVSTLVGQTLIGLIRDPVARFIAACARLKITPDEGLSSTSIFFDAVCHEGKESQVNWFRFPEHLTQFCEVVGIPVPEKADASGDALELPTLTEAQLASVQAKYAADIALYNATTGTLNVPPIAAPSPTPLTAAQTIQSGIEWVSSQGFDSMRLVALLNLFLSSLTQVAGVEATLAAAKPKLVAVYDWTQVVQATAAGGGTTFPPAPHTFEEVIAESHS